ncbi:diacylglycerol kinase family lipid kinase [Lysinibacillus sp. 1 U-2021]|uniref:diacylglycerol/lipid kinase family protein n=1 Tax=unclassified Lysinibacillus TaxID=2636778 RepID=UPI001ED9EFC6|nr:MULTISPECIES: diacylglycerol kinase family protein [unclassified Lysinibacillus]UKJ44474.1 diacylglycerol kinase family lipid kinase [Lysinibacillus sp. ACHW1.5]WGT40063.1 diacylglycerol kinase family lipid kinase [Lysinibacillus sp. 1 U-2021]
MQVLFIVNEAAGNGKGKKVWLQLQQQLTISYQVAFTEYEGHGQEIAKRWAQQQQEHMLIVVVGGDGTIHEVVSGVVHNKFVIIGVVRAGSGNDFARFFPTFHHARQIEDYARTTMANEKMDAGVIQLGDRWNEIFVNNAGIGFDAYVTKSINASRLKFYLNKIGLGKLSYAVAVMRGLFRFERFDVTIRSGEQEWQFKQAWFVAMSNQPYFGGGMKISPAAKADDGQVDITIVHGISRIKLLLIFVTVFFEKHTKFKEITFLQGQYFEMSVGTHQVDGHTDGNYIGVVDQGTPIHCTVQQNAWQVIAKYS